MIKIKPFASGSSGNLYYVYNEKTKILLECGLAKELIIKKLWEYSKTLLTDIDVVLCSHSHNDHSKSIVQLYDYGLNIYCSSQTKEKFVLNNANEIIDNKLIKIKTIDVLPFKLHHGDAECYGFIFHDKDNLIFFATDFMYMEQNFSSFKFNEIYIETNYCNDKIINALNKEKISDLESVKLQRQINTHASEETALKCLKSMNLSKCEKIFCIHLSKEFSNINIIKNKLYNNLNIPIYCINSKGEIN